MIEKKRTFFVFLTLFLSTMGILGLGALASYTRFRHERREAKARMSVPSSRSVAAMVLEVPRGVDT